MITRLAALAALALAPSFSSCIGPCGACGEPGSNVTEGEQEVWDLLGEQEAAWNRGDLEAFMRLGYWNSKELTFYSGGEITRGFDEMLERYRRNYESPGKERGHLTFNIYGVQALADDAALAHGRWDLDYEAKPDVGGLFTLVLRKELHGWRIIHDHTSADG